MRVVCFLFPLYMHESGLDNTTSVAGFQELFGSVVALPAVAEKGYIDVQLSVASPGGHSSIPPEHTVGSIFPILGRSLICFFP